MALTGTHTVNEVGHVNDHNLIDARLVELDKKITVSSTAPTSPATNDLWVDTS